MGHSIIYGPFRSQSDSALLAFDFRTEAFRRIQLISRVNVKCKESFIDFDIYHRMVSMQKLKSVTLTYFLKVKNKNNNVCNCKN